jgi:hypothetical protein
MPRDEPQDFFGTAIRFPGETEEATAAHIRLKRLTDP